MRKEEFYVLNSLYNGSIGRAGCTYDVEETKALNDTDIYNKLVNVHPLLQKDPLAVRVIKE